MGGRGLKAIMDFLYFIYGLSFFAIGLVVAVRHDGDSRLDFNRALWLLAAFGFTHAFREWMDLWRVVHGDTPVLAEIRPALLLLSYLFLFEFGRRLLRGAFGGGRRLGYWVYVPLLAGLAAGSLAGPVQTTLPLWTRWLFGFPSALLAGIGFIVWSRRLAPSLDGPVNRGVTIAFQAAGAGFIAYSLFGGLIGPAAPWFPASAINQARFLAVFHLPVQVLRVACAVGIAVAVGTLIRIFHLETRKRLRDSESRYRSLFDLAPDAVIVHAEGLICFANPAAAQLFAVAVPDDLVGVEIMSLIHPDFRKVAADRIDRVQRLGATLPVVAETLLRRDGEAFVAEVSARPIAVGTVSGSLTVIRDVTERSAAAAAVERERLRLRHILQTASDGIHIVDESGTLLEASDSFYHMLGYGDDRPPLNITDWEAKFAPDAVLAHLRDWRHIDIQDGVPGNMGAPHVFETRHRRRDGSLIDVEVNSKAVMFEGQRYLFASARDITERKRNEAALRDSEERFRHLFDDSPVALSTSARDGCIVLINREFVSLFGYSHDDIPTVAEWRRRAIPETERDHHRQDWEAKWIQSAAAVSFGQIHEQMVICRDGSTKTVLLKRMHLGDHVAIAAIDITDRKRNEAALRDSELLFRAIFEQNAIGFVLVSFAGRIEAFNHRFRDIVGYGPEDLSGLTYADITYADDPAPSREEWARLEAGQAGAANFETRYRRRDGTPVWVRLTIALHRDEKGSPLQFIIAVEDIDAWKAAGTNLRLAASVFANSYDGVVIADSENRIIDVNPAFTRITGYSLDEVAGQNPKLLASGHQDEAFYAAMWQSLKESGFWRGEIWNRRKTGEVYAEMLSISVVHDETGQIQNYVAVFSDISSFKRHEAELERIAHYDSLTGLPNRRLLADRLDQAIARAGRFQQSLAVCYLDLDGFKPVNDKYGHNAGDRLLVEVAKRIQEELRTNDTVARLGGDEFVLLLADLPRADECWTALDRLLKAIARPFLIGKISVTVSASIGVTLCPPDEPDSDILLRHADRAMYRAKESGKNCYHLFDAEQDRQVKDHQTMQQRLRQALKKNEFVLFYQPKVDVVSGEIIGAEALIRWIHPEEGLLQPADFLPYIHGSGLEIPLGEWVIETALRQLETWQAAGWSFKVSVNIDAVHLLSADFSLRLRQALDRHASVPPGNLELEILETAALGDVDQARKVLTECREMGVEFALDDFGTGYSSLAYFRQLPLNALKIDQSFVANMLEDPSDLDIVESIIHLANVFHRPVIAEGVETPEHGTLLALLGCRLAQGYGIARPMAADQMAGWAERWRQRGAWGPLRDTVGREDLLLMVAAHSHRTWIDTLIDGLDDPEAVRRMKTDPYQCQFGRWYHASGSDRYGALAEFVALAPVHERVHQVAEDLLALAQAGDIAGAKARVPELLRLRDELLALFDALVIRVHGEDSEAGPSHGHRSTPR